MSRIEMVQMEVVRDSCTQMYAGAPRCTDVVAFMASHNYTSDKRCETAGFRGARGCEEEGFVFTRRH